MTYALLLGLRIMLTVAEENKVLQMSSIGCRIGNSALLGETQIDNGLICRDNHYRIDPFYLEFASIFGARLTPLLSHEDAESLASLAKQNKTKHKPNINAKKHHISVLIGLQILNT